jgi:hypothetical protein
MVNYNDPATIAQDFCACAFSLGLEGLHWQSNLLVGLFHSDTR